MKSFSRAFLSASCLAMLLAFNLPAHAEAPIAKGQAPGWYRMMLGQFEITALSDGTVALPVGSPQTTSLAPSLSIA